MCVLKTIINFAFIPRTGGQIDTNVAITRAPPTPQTNSFQGPATVWNGVKVLLVPIQNARGPWSFLGYPNLFQTFTTPHDNSSSTSDTCLVSSFPRPFLLFGYYSVRLRCLLELLYKISPKLQKKEIQFGISLLVFSYDTLFLILAIAVLM